MTLPLTKEQEAWMEAQARRTRKRITHVIKTKDPNINPCIAYFGNGPEGERCKHCSHPSRQLASVRKV